MKALICRNHGLPKTLEIGEMPDPMPGPGEVLVEVSAAAMNFFDFLIIQDKYQFKPPLPFSPGGEGAGVVTALGEGVTPGENGPAIGTRVAFNSGWGAFAEQVAIPARQAYPIPDEMSFEIAAGLIITYATTIHAYKQRADLQAGETVAVLGAAGGVGLTAIELAKAMGARVIACASTDEKLAVCAEHGADAVVNYATEDLKVRLKELTDGRGVDVVYDPVGGTFPNRRCGRWRQRGGTLSSALRRATFRVCPGTLPCSRKSRSSACSGAASPGANRTRRRKTWRTSLRCSLMGASNRIWIAPCRSPILRRAMSA